MSTKLICLVTTNLVMFAGWAHVIYVFVTAGLDNLSDFKSEICEDRLRPALYMALTVSAIELLTCMIGLTRSNPIQVLLFASVRAGVEILITPLIGCGAWQHLFTALCWSLGDSVRFACFTLDGIVPGGTLAKSIRYTFGPIMFPLGTAGEMFMVIRAAMNGRPILYLAAALWPAGFYPLMKQLLKQRRKHFAPKKKPEFKSV